MSHTLTLTDHELRLVLASLLAVTPSGGGSGTLHLRHKIESFTATEVDENLAIDLCERAAREYVSGLSSDEVHAFHSRTL